MGTLTFIIVLGILIFVHEFGHFIIAKRRGVRVEKFSFGFGPKLFGIKRGDTEYLISAVPLGGYVKMAGDEPGEEVKGKPWEYLSKSVGARASIIVAGPLVNYILGFVLFVAIFIAGNPMVISRVGGVMDNFPAKKAGLMKGDLIVSIDGKPTAYWEEMTAIIHKSKGAPSLFHIKRNNRELDIAISPKVSEVKDLFGNKVTIGQIGVMPSSEVVMVKHNPAEAVYLAGKKVFEFTAITYKALWGIIIGKMKAKESLIGPIGIFFITQEASKLGIVYLLWIMGSLSISLALFNLLPIPILDGGHLLFLVIEKFRKKPLSLKIQEIATQVALGFLVFLIVVILYNDVIKFGVLDKIKGVFIK